MISVYAKVGEDDTVRRLDGEQALEALPQAVWVDLLSPRQEEVAAVEAALKVAIPARAQMQEIETSSRLRRESDAVLMTVTLLSNVSTPQPQCGAVTFILCHQRLVTLRYSDPLPFKVFGQTAVTNLSACSNGTTAMLGLFSAVIDRLADVIEICGQDVEAIAQEVFRQADVATGRQNYSGIIPRIGRTADIVSKARESIMSLSRALTFLSLTTTDTGAKKDLRNLLKNESRDLASISTYADFVSDKIAFLLDATLGMIGQQQNTIMKIFSVLAMVFLPPTLIGSIYGMNFQDMPELSWHFGYPLALSLMVASACLPYLFFKRKGWL